MDNEVLIEDRIVTWDENKDAINRRKHGISFFEASRVFLDDNRIDFPDEKHSDYEERSITIGRVGKILFVVYTERDDKTRIITARKATKYERSLYYGGIARL